MQQYNNNNNNEEGMYSVAQLARRINTSKRFIYTHIKDKKLPAVRIGRLWMFDRNTVEKLIQSGKLLRDN